MRYANHKLWCNLSFRLPWGSSGLIYTGLIHLLPSSCHRYGSLIYFVPSDRGSLGLSDRLSGLLGPQTVPRLSSFTPRPLSFTETGSSTFSLSLVTSDQMGDSRRFLDTPLGPSAGPLKPFPGPLGPSYRPLGPSHRI